MKNTIAIVSCCLLALTVAQPTMWCGCPSTDAGQSLWLTNYAVEPYLTYNASWPCQACFAPGSNTIWDAWNNTVCQATHLCYAHWANATVGWSNENTFTISSPDQFFGNIYDWASDGSQYTGTNSSACDSTTELCYLSTPGAIYSAYVNTYYADSGFSAEVPDQISDGQCNWGGCTVPTYNPACLGPVGLDSNAAGFFQVMYYVAGYINSWTMDVYASGCSVECNDWEITNDPDCAGSNNAIGSPCVTESQIIDISGDVFYAYAQPFYENLGLNGFANLTNACYNINETVLSVFHEIWCAWGDDWNTAAC